MIGLSLITLAQNVVKTLGRQVVAGLLQLATIAVIARAVGPEGNGAYNMALLLPTMLAALLNLGVGPANVYYLGVRRVSLHSAWQTTLRFWFVIVLVGLSLGCAVIVWFAADWFPGVAASFLWIALFCFPALLLVNLICSLFQGIQHFREFNLIMLLQPFLAILFIVGLQCLDLCDVHWLLSAYLLSVVVTLLVGSKLLVDLLPATRNIATGNYAKNVVRYGYKAHLSNMLTFINYKADMLLVNFFLGPAAAGVYVIAVQLGERLWMLSQSVSTVILPRLSELSNEEDKRQQLTPLISRWVLWFTFSIAILLGAVSYPLFVLLFGKEFLDGVLPLLLLLPGITAMAPARVLANDIAARGRPGLNAYSSCAALLVNIVGNLLLIPIYGLAGAAVATSAAYLVIFSFCLWMHYRFTGLSVWHNLVISRCDFEMIRAYLRSRR